MSHGLFVHSTFSDTRAWAFLKQVDAAEAKICRSAVSAPGTALLTGEEEDFSERSSGQIGGGEPGRQQRFDVAERPDSGQLGECPTQVGVGLESVCLRALDERVQPSAGVGAGHDEGAAAWGRIASLLETCKMNGVEPYAWLKSTVEKIAGDHPQSRVRELLLWNFDPASN